MIRLARTSRALRCTGLVLVAASCLASAAQGDTTTQGVDCTQAPVMGHFDSGKDLFLAHFDVKTDVDDLHAAAAVATMLAEPSFACVQHVAVAGTYGTQDGDYVAAPTLFDQAYGEQWQDAHGRRKEAIRNVADRVIETLAGGGEVWVMEGGQSDFSAAVLAEVLEQLSGELTRSSVHIVQHADWNEEVTSPDALAYVKRHADYRKIPDGNAAGNGSPNYRTPDSGHWQRLLADKRVGKVWMEARRIADEYNGKGYFNEAVAAGGLDYSDTVEAVYIFGLMDLVDTPRFLDHFVAP